MALKKVDLAPPGRATFRTEFGKFRAKGDMRLESRTWILADEGWIITISVQPDGDWTLRMNARASLKDARRGGRN